MVNEYPDIPLHVLESVLRSYCHNPAVFKGFKGAQAPSADGEVLSAAMTVIKRGTPEYEKIFSANVKQPNKDEISVDSPAD
jgi:hypothetical protein